VDEVIQSVWWLTGGGATAKIRSFQLLTPGPKLRSEKLSAVTENVTGDWSFEPEGDCVSWNAAKEANGRDNPRIIPIPSDVKVIIFFMVFIDVVRPFII
jgi:hypothetical protein